MKYVSLVLALLVVSVGAASLAAQIESQGLILERIIVRVNGEILTQSQLTQRQTDAIRQKSREAPTTDAAVMKLINEVTPDVLVDAVDEMLIAQHGREMGGKFTDEQFERAIEDIKRENNIDDKQLKEAMDQEGLTMEQLRTNFERAFMMQVVQRNEIFRRMNITDEELRQYYNGHKQELMTPEAVTLREITVAATPQEAEAARARIDAIRAKALAGEDFVELVKTSSDSTSKANGGLIGPLSPDDINPALRDVIQKLQPGEITEPMALPRGGYQILKLETRDVSTLPPFDKARDRIEQGIRAERLGGEMAKIVSRLRSEAVIEWKDDTLKQIYQQRLVERAPGPLASR